MKKKSILLIVLLVLFTGCSKNDDQDDQVFRAAIEKKFKADEEGVDSLILKNGEDVQITDEDRSVLEEKYHINIEVKKKKYDVKYSNITLDGEGELTALIAKVDNNWEAVYLDRGDILDWKFTPKVSTNTYEILLGLRGTEFENFKEGYIGDEEKTFVSVESRDLEGNKETINMVIEVENSFANYSFKAVGEYLFIGGKWVQKSINPDSMDKWKINYKAIADEPTPKKGEDIIKDLSNDKSFISYLYNKDYVSKVDIGETLILPSDDKIVYRYMLNIVYDNIGTFDYIVDLPVKWVGETWKENTLITRVVQSDFNALTGIWKSGEEKFEIKEIDEDNVIKGTDDKGEIELILNVPLRDDKWDVKITKGFVGHDDSKESYLDLKNKQIIISGKTFKKVTKEG